MAYWPSGGEEIPTARSQQEDGPNRDLSPPNCPVCHRPMNDGLGDQRHCLQRDDARFKAVWSKEMGDPGEGSVYSTVSVLLVSWNDEAGDLKTGEEVQKLQHVLEEKYNFSVEDKRLDATKPAQVQLNQHLANFVAEKHDENGLLIVYYAGHGIPGNMPGTLTLAGSRNPEHHDSEKKMKLNQIVWHRAENLIKDSLGDVLIIFDCCAAGNLARDIRARGHWPQRAFEFIGATIAEQTTPEPGPNSFTSGLIWALEKLANEDGFTPSELLQEITQAPGFPRNQYPVHHDRDRPSLRKILISPLPQGGSRQKETPAKTSTAVAERLEFLDLRVILSRHPTKDDISTMAHALKEMLRTQSMPVARHIAWGKLSAIEVSTERFSNLVWNVLAIQTIQKWWRTIRNKRVTKGGLHRTETPNGHASPSHQGVSPDALKPSGKRQRLV